MAKTVKRTTPKRTAPKRTVAKRTAPKRVTRRRTATGATAGGDALPQVRVRMYRQGLGDCFLITFDVGGNERHMLIDCGTLGAQTTGVTMSQVMKDIAATSGNNLEILMATHAHKDHVSGFLSEWPTLQGIKVANVWMGWTEDPSDDLARKLGKTASALRAAVGNALKLSSGNAGLHSRLSGVAEFEGLGDDGLAMGATIAQALDKVRKFPGAQMSYHSPGPPFVQVAAIPGFRFYMLGPPRDPKKIASMGDTGNSELYGLASALRAQAAGLGAMAMDDQAPFEARFGHAIEGVEGSYRGYAADDEAYRRIDGQWMEQAAELAAALDRFRNNTSLAIAIERIADGKVLLFPADAQLGNWSSWHDETMKWQVDSKTIDAANLLSRVVFYKVGHHSSHNATAKGKGLEMMRRNKDLVAFIPVDRQVALKKSPPGSWRMPAVALYKALLDACEGRVLRSDIGWVDDAKNAARPDVEHELLNAATPSEWARFKASQAQATHVTPKDLYVDYLLK